MSRLTVGVVDYGVGNHSSVWHCLHDLNVRARVSDDPGILTTCDLLLLPGVGAFRPAMKALESKGLDKFLIDQAVRHRPILGICLGMQLLTQGSEENGHTPGLGLIPGEVVPLERPRWHIGWNTVQLVRDDPLFESSAGETFFFNHSYAYGGPPEYQICRTRTTELFASAIRRGAVVGVQFHPEKSQQAGQTLLRKLVHGLVDA